MLFPKTVQFRPYRTASSIDVAAAISSMMTNAKQSFRYQCPRADIAEIVAGRTPPEIRLFVEDTDVRSGPQPDAHFIETYDPNLFTDVIVSEVRGQLPPENNEGVRFSDYVMIETDGKTIFATGTRNSVDG